MTEKQNMISCRLYNSSDSQITSDNLRARTLCREYNLLSPSHTHAREAYLRLLLPNASGAHITPPFYCSFGYNITAGDNFKADTGLTIEDNARVTFGSNVTLRAGCLFVTPSFPASALKRKEGLRYALPIRVGNNVTFGPYVTVLPGVTIGDNSVIDAGSVVSSDVPPGCFASGNPCRAVKPLQTPVQAVQCPMDEGRRRARLLCSRLNELNPSDTQKRDFLLQEIIPSHDGYFRIRSPFECEYGTNISIGRDFLANYGLVIRDFAPVTFGDNVFVGPRVIIDTQVLQNGAGTALPIRIGNSVWFGCEAVVRAGVTIGNNCVIGAGAVVTDDIPDNSLAGGCPARVIRGLTEDFRVGR